MDPPQIVNPPQICILLIQGGGGMQSMWIHPGSTINNFVNPPQIYSLLIEGICGCALDQHSSLILGEA